jgi:hypothetical protein
MMMSNENVVSIQIPKDDLKKVMQHLKEIDAILKPYLVALTPDERKTIAKMSDKTLPFVEKVMEYAEINPQFAPMFMNVSEMKIDLEAVAALNPILKLTDQLCDNLNDTVMLSGSEAYIASLAYYNTVKQGAKMNVPDAKAIYDDLSKRFERGKASKENS